MFARFFFNYNVQIRFLHRWFVFTMKILNIPVFVMFVYNIVIVDVCVHTLCLFGKKLCKKNPLAVAVVSRYRDPQLQVGKKYLYIRTIWSKTYGILVLIIKLIFCFDSKQYRFFKKNHSVPSPCNPRKTLQGFSRGCMVIVLNASF